MPDSKTPPKVQTEEEWEEEILSEALDGILLPDGSLDMEKLHTTSITLTFGALTLYYGVYTDES